ncbi:phospholipase A [Pontibacter chitinilyticus]|uniref:phospholipase A n=1 Tax=Pontibacter chitinilyticus TaxID=2674989 RepID=UPI00321B71B1
MASGRSKAPYTWLAGFFILLAVASSSYGQQQKQINHQIVKQMLQEVPPISIYDDNYFVTGAAIGQKPTTENADVKYQVSVKYRFTNAVLPLQTYLFLAYTQKAFWNIYRFSSPFKEINFHPALGLGKLLLHDGELVGALALQVEHESNGQDTIGSRSWNFVSFSYSGVLSPRSIITLKAWYPFLYKGDNPDLISYIGYGEAKYTYAIKKDKLLLEVSGRKGATRDWKGNLQAQLSYNPFKKPNLFLMLQWYQGYAESLSDYRQKTSIIRAGVGIKPIHYIY